jgi:hypothetical protein
MHLLNGLGFEFVKIGTDGVDFSSESFDVDLALPVVGFEHGGVFEGLNWTKIGLFV